MSIDAQIKRLELVMSELTASVVELTAAVKTMNEHRAFVPPATLTVSEPVAIVHNEAPEPEVKAEASEPVVETKKIERADVSAACRALQQKDGNSDRAKKVLAQFGAKKVPDLTDAQLADAYYAFEAAATEEELA